MDCFKIDQKSINLNCMRKVFITLLMFSFVEIHAQMNEDITDKALKNTIDIFFNSPSLIGELDTLSNDSVILINTDIFLYHHSGENDTIINGLTFKYLSPGEIDYFLLKNGPVTVLHPCRLQVYRNLISVSFVFVIEYGSSTYVGISAEYKTWFKYNKIRKKWKEVIDPYEIERRKESKRSMGKIKRVKRKYIK